MFREASPPPAKDQYAYSERANLEPQTDNLLILGESGDVLEALTRVPELAEKYVGKVKLIYIDPPFNTAQTFASYEDNLEHSIWLTMMRDRLIHLKKLLSADGSIWVHLDDVENHRMRLLMDEVFGAQNFVAQVAWEKTYAPRGDAQGFSTRIDTLLVYQKCDQFVPKKIQQPASANQFRNIDIEGRRYRLRQLRKDGSNSLRTDRPNLWFPIIAPDGSKVLPYRDDDKEGRWRWGKERIESNYESLVWIRRKNRLMPYVKQFADSSGERAPETFWASSSTGQTHEANTEIKALFPGMMPFSTPKPERLLERIIHIGSNPGDIVLDVFAGSGTTAAVAQKMGRRWVTCELREDTFTTFIRPRLEKVINDQDPGGITRTKGERIAADGVDLPDGVTPDDAAKFTSVLNKLIAASPELKSSPDVKALKAAAKTQRSKEVINWRGGGGFQVAHVSPSCFDYDPKLGRVMLTPEATGQTLIESVAANLGFTLLNPDDDYIFDARRGNALLKVIEGAATPDIVDSLATHIQEGETIVLAATSVMDGVRQYLRKMVKGAKVVALPDDVFPYSEGGDE